jgi:CheY-like chemotaxis protein
MWEFDVTRKEFRFSKQKSQPPDRRRWHKLSTWQTKLHQKDLPSITATLSSVLSGNADNIDTIHRVRSNNGSWRWLRIQGRVTQRDRKGAPYRLTGIISASAIVANGDKQLDNQSPPPTTSTTQTPGVTKSVNENERGRPRSILLVDDNTAGAQTMSMLLSLEGHTVSIATTGLEAVRLFEELKPEFVLLDIGLPDTNGHAVAQSIRSIQGEARPTIIALTGWGTERDRELSREAGCDAHLTKPVHFDELESFLSGHALPLGSASNDDR